MNVYAAIENNQTDRYITFCGINCDENADHLIAMLEQHIAADDGDGCWKTYFQQKRQQQAKMGHDNLYFIGSQMNNLYAYFEECENQDALALLWQVEQECC